jgi:uncharacterized membrane protein
MPFCSQCGKAVHDADTFCSRCGKQQPPSAGAQAFGYGAPPPPPGYRPTAPMGADPMANVPPRTWAILCYIPAIGWIASIIVLASDRFKRDRPLRFHAFQGLYLFVAWLIADWVLRPISYAMPMIHFEVYRLVELALLGLSIFMMVKAAHNEVFSLPIFGELAERSLSEN